MFIAARNPRSYFQQVSQAMDAVGISVSFLLKICMLSFPLILQFNVCIIKDAARPNT